MIGIDIGATKALGVVVGGDGTVVAQVRHPTETGPGGVLRTAARVIADLADTDTPDSDVVIGVPGVVDHHRGEVTHAVNLGIDGVPFALADRLADRTGRRVAVENDVNVAAVGIASLTGTTDLVYLGIGTGLAAGVVVGGRLRRGTKSAAGEVGHISVDPAGAPCGCGQRGCLETIASGSALERAWPDGGPARLRSLQAAAQAGDDRAATVWRDFGDALAQAVTVVALSVDPASIVLGGGVAEAGETLRLAVVEALDARAGRSPFLASLDLPARVELAPRSPYAAIGAAVLGVNRS